jgi:hypothetical protein
MSAGGAAGSGGVIVGGGGSAGGETDPPAVTGQPVAASEVALQPVVDSGLTNFVALVRYDVDEATAAAASQPPMYQPYDGTAPAFWDNVVAELLQAREPFVALPSRGAFTLTPTDLTGPGNENPRQLSGWAQAVARANAGALFDAICLVDTPYLQQTSNSFHSRPSATPFDLSVSSDWADIVWARTIKPWFDTVPSTALYEPWDAPLVQFSALPSTGFKNASGNLSAMLTSVANAFNAAYHLTPSFVLDQTWFAADPTLTNNQFVGTESPWLTPSTASSSSAFSYSLGATIGTVVPGFAAPAIPRHSQQVATLLTGLNSAVQNSTEYNYTILQGFTDFADSAGFYRSNATDWTTPNEYLNLVRRFSDPTTVTERLEAEGCDSYSDTTPGNSGNAFRRSGDLDIRALSGSGWAVTNTAVGEWLEFDNVDFSAGNYKFVAKYATTAGQTAGAGPRLELVFDGVKLAPVIVPKTATADAFVMVSLGQQTVTHGPHTLRLRFLDGLVDVDWLFIEKVDVTLNLQAPGGTFVSASSAGGSDLNYAAPAANIWETLTFDDLNGGALADGDTIYVQSYDGLYVTVGANHVVTVDQRQPSNAAKFTIRVQGGGAFVSGAKIALQTSDGHYLNAGAGKEVDALATTIGTNQLFKLGF